MLFGIIGFGLLLLALGAWMLHRRTVAKVAAAAGWPRAEGRVEACDILFDPGRGDDHDSWRLGLRYGYTAGGTAHIGKKVRLGPDPVYHVEREVEEVAARYPVGSSVSVAYNPADPVECALETDRASATWRSFALILAAIGIVFIGLGFLPG